jgi:hypothetical protein
MPPSVNPLRIATLVSYKLHFTNILRTFVAGLKNNNVII